METITPTASAPMSEAQQTSNIRYYLDRLRQAKGEVAAIKIMPHLEAEYRLLLLAAKDRYDEEIRKRPLETPAPPMGANSQVAAKNASNGICDSVLAKLKKKAKENYWLVLKDVDEALKYSAAVISPADLNNLNTFFAENHKRKITHLDIAFIWFAFKKNVEKNEDHSSPVKGVKGLATSIVNAKIIKAAPEDLHITSTIEYFMALWLARRDTEADHKNHKAATYTILKQPLC